MSRCRSLRHASSAAGWLFALGSLVPACSSASHLDDREGLAGLEDENTLQCVAKPQSEMEESLLRLFDYTPADVLAAVPANWSGRCTTGLTGSCDFSVAVQETPGDATYVTATRLRKTPVTLQEHAGCATITPATRVVIRSCMAEFDSTLDNGVTVRGTSLVSPDTRIDWDGPSLPAGVPLIGREFAVGGREVEMWFSVDPGGTWWSSIEMDGRYRFQPCESRP